MHCTPICRGGTSALPSVYKIKAPLSDGIDRTKYGWNEARMIVTGEVDAIEAFFSRQAKTIT